MTILFLINWSFGGKKNNSSELNIDIYCVHSLRTPKQGALCNNSLPFMSAFLLKIRTYWMKFGKSLAQNPLTKILVSSYITTTGSFYITSLDSEDLSKVCFFSLLHKGYKWSLTDSDCFPVATGHTFPTTLECTERKEEMENWFCWSLSAIFTSTFCHLPFNSWRKTIPWNRNSKKDLHLYSFTLNVKGENCYESWNESD